MEWTLEQSLERVLWCERARAKVDGRGMVVDQARMEDEARMGEEGRRSWEQERKPQLDEAQEKSRGLWM